MKDTYVQFGCGHSAPDQWTNFDASPTLRIQRLPVVGKILKNRLNTVFPSNVLYGDIVTGLSIKENSCNGIYASHVLEHLSLTDFRRALKNTYHILKPGRIFRSIVPDLEYYARQYLQRVEGGDEEASLDFVDCHLMLGVKTRPKGITQKVKAMWSNLHHLWMWDAKSMTKELRDCGFTNIRICKFNDCEDEMFKLVEEEDRFKNAVAIECKK